MTTKDLQFKINNLKEVLKNFSNEDKKMTGVTIIRENSSDNWLFNTEVDITSIVPVVVTALQKEIDQLEEERLSLIVTEEQERLAEVERQIQLNAEQQQQRLTEIDAEKEIKFLAYKEEIKMKLQAEREVRKELGL